MDMVFTEEVGFSVWERRDRYNVLLEATEELTRNGNVIVVKGRRPRKEAHR